MIKTRVVVHQCPGGDEAGRAVLALLAMGLEADARHVRVVTPLADEGAGDTTISPRPTSVSNAWQVSVAEDEVDAAVAIVAEALSTEAALPPPSVPRPPILIDGGAGIWTLANASSSLAIAALCIVVHLAVHGGGGPSPRSRMIEVGAVAPWLVTQGEWWRLGSAVFLHFDLKHLVGNMSSLLFLGPALAAQAGHLRTIALFLATGVAGNILSQFFGDEAAIRAGASGGICGLLGALAGVTLAVMAEATDARERRPAWQTLGALVALFGMMVGFEAGHDHYAHVGGMIAGIVLGHRFGPRTTAREDAR